jgi:hypothetical protein
MSQGARPFSAMCGSSFACCPTPNPTQRPKCHQPHPSHPHTQRMAESIPSASQSAGDAADDETQALPNNAEDRKAAAALNSLHANDLSQDNTAAKQPSAADQEALGKAMNRLEIASMAGKKKKDESEGKKEEGKKEVVKKKIKISSEDVTFLVSQMEDLLHGRY